MTDRPVSEVPPASAAPPLPAGVERVTELQDRAGGLFVHAQWRSAMPWLVQGITARGGDMSLFAGSPAGDVIERWVALRDGLGAHAVVHARQVHAARVLTHEAIPEGLLLAPDADGHATTQPGALLAVSVADCVPISIVAQSRRAVALLHGGWRGVAAGILETGIALLHERYGAEPADLRVHLGPAICGDCFEVGPEVPERLGIAVRPGARLTVDLRAVLARRAITRGVGPDAVSISTFCTRCSESPFYSHRGGCRERQIAVLGIHDSA